MLNLVMQKRIAKKKIIELNEPRLKKQEQNYSDEAK